MKRIILLLVLFMILTTGCWDLKDINNRAFVAAIGLDEPEDSTQKFKVSFQFWDPIKLQHDSQKTTLTESIEAESISQAIEFMQARIAQDITFTHLQLLLVGEELAKSNSFQDLANFFLKHPEVALRLRLAFIEEQTALQALKSKPKLMPNITYKIVSMTQLEKNFSLPRTNTFYFFLSDLRKTNGTAFGSRVILPDEFIIRHGGSVFGDWKLQGFLSAEETQAANWLTGKGQANIIGNTQDGTYTYLAKIKKLDTNIIETSNGLPKFAVNLEVNGSIVEEEGKHIDLFKPENIDKMEKLFSEVITQQIKNAIIKSQKEFGIDYLGFGQILRQREPKIYESIDWQKEFPNIPIDVSVKAKVKRFGFTK